MSRTVISEHLATIEEKIKLKLQMALIEEDGKKSVELFFLVKKSSSGWLSGIDRWVKVHFKPADGEMFAHTIKVSYKDRNTLEGVIVVDSPLVLDSTVMVDFHNHVGAYAEHLVMLKIYDIRGTAGKVMAKDTWPDLTETREVVKSVFQQPKPAFGNYSGLLEGREGPYSARVDEVETPNGVLITIRVKCEFAFNTDGSYRLTSGDSQRLGNETVYIQEKELTVNFVHPTTPFYKKDRACINVFEGTSGFPVSIWVTRKLPKPELPDENTVVVLPYSQYQLMDMDELLDNLKAVTAAIENKAKGVRK